MGARARVPALGDRAGLGAARAARARARRARACGRSRSPPGSGRPRRRAATRRSRSRSRSSRRARASSRRWSFQFASTNLVFELGIVIWIFLGWQFTLAELVGGAVLIVLMWIGVRVLRLAARGGAGRASARRRSTPGTSTTPPAAAARRLSLEAWSDVAHNFRGDWEMLWKEIGAGFLIAGFVALLPQVVLQRALPDRTRRRAAAGRERARRAARGRALVRLLGRERRRSRRCSGRAGSRSPA